MELSAKQHQAPRNPGMKSTRLHLGTLDVLCIALVAGLAVATYVAWIDNYLVADSWALIGAISQPDWTLSNLLPFQPVLHRINSTDYYAPVWTSVLWVAFRLGGYSPERYHLIAIACHTFISICVYVAAMRFTGSRLKALIAGSIFAVHFASTEAVGWAGSMSYPVAGVIGIMALLSYLQFLADRRRIWWLAAVGALILVALTLANGLAWFAIAVWLDMTYGRDIGGWRGFLQRSSVLTGLAVAILSMQLHAFRAAPGGYQYHIGHWVILNLFYYPVSTILPSLEPKAYGLARDLALITSQPEALGRLLSTPDTYVLMLGACLSVLVAIMAWAKGDRCTRFALVAFGLALTPYLLVNGQGYRYLYVPLMFFSIAVANAVVDAYQANLPVSRTAAAVVLASVVVFVSLSYFESQRQMFWWQQAGLVAHNSLQQMQEIQPSLPKGAKLVFGDIPDTLPGTNAEVWRNGFSEALQAIYNDRTLRIEAYSRPEVEKLLKNELNGAPNTYVFVWEDWHFRRLQP